MEAWKSVVGFEGLYEVSDLGRVRSLDRVLTHPTAKRGFPKTWRGRVLKPQRHSGGYAQVSLGGVQLVHTLVLAAFIGPRPNGAEACHADGDRWNNKLENLRYDTHVANCEDRRAHGFSVLGERNKMAKLTAADVLRIRRLKGHGTQKEIAARFSVSDRTVGKIHRGERWSHV